MRSKQCQAEPRCSGLGEHHDGFWANAVDLHGISRRAGLHHLLEGAHVGDVDDQADTVALRRVDERPSRDAQRAAKRAGSVEV